MGSQPIIRVQLRKILGENLAGKYCRTGRRGKCKFKKDSDWWKVSIWNRVMGSQPIRIQLRKMLWEILAGKSCDKLLRENLVAKFLQEIVAGKSCGKILQYREGGEKANLRKAVIGGDLAFGIG